MAWSMSNTREAPIPPERIFGFYADPATWPLWGHNTIGTDGQAPVTEGATVQVTAGYRRTWPVLIRRVVPDRLVLCEVRPPGVTILSTYEVTPTRSGSRLRHEIEVSGRLAPVYRLLRPLYVRLLAKETRKLVALAQHPKRE